jgi:hypothetical protein
VAYDAADHSTRYTTGDGSALGVRAGRFGAVAEGEGAKSGYGDEVCFFHDVVWT